MYLLINRWDVTLGKRKPTSVGPCLAQQGPHQAHEHREPSRFSRVSQEPTPSVTGLMARGKKSPFREKKVMDLGSKLKVFVGLCSFCKCPGESKHPCMSMEKSHMMKNRDSNNCYIYMRCVALSGLSMQRIYSLTE